jgi:hypothetical protein
MDWEEHRRYLTSIDIFLQNGQEVQFMSEIQSDEARESRFMICGLGICLPGKQRYDRGLRDAEGEDK